MSRASIQNLHRRPAVEGVVYRVMDVGDIGEPCAGIVREERGFTRKKGNIIADMIEKPTKIALITPPLTVREQLGVGFVSELHGVLIPANQQKNRPDLIEIYGQEFPLADLMKHNIRLRIIDSEVSRDEAPAFHREGEPDTTRFLHTH